MPPTPAQRDMPLRVRGRRAMSYRPLGAAHPELAGNARRLFGVGMGGGSVAVAIHDREDQPAVPVRVEPDRLPGLQGDDTRPTAKWPQRRFQYGCTLAFRYLRRISVATRSASVQVAMATLQHVVHRTWGGCRREFGSGGSVGSGVSTHDTTPITAVRSSWRSSGSRAITSPRGRSSSRYFCA